MFQVKKILYPTDFSPYSTQAYFHAVALAEKYGASLTILYVFTPSAGPATPANGANDPAYWRSQLEQIHPLNPDIAVQHVFLEGDPASEIVRFSRESVIDLIVMGTHGRTGLERLLMGSVAERVMREAPCTVMVAKLPKGIPQPEKAEDPVIR